MSPYSTAAHGSVDTCSDASARRSRLEPSTKLLERIAAGESVRALAGEIGVAHSTLLRALRRPKVASELDAIKQRQRLEQRNRCAKERGWEKELPRRARELEKRDELWGRADEGRLSHNDTVAAQVVTTGGGIQELTAATGLRTRLAVYEAIDPRLVQRARANDRHRPSEQAAPGDRFEPSLALIERRAAGESLRSLAPASGVSYSTLSRAFARPHVKTQVLAAKRRLHLSLRLEQARRAARNAVLANLAAHYKNKITDVWCLTHHRRTYVRNVEISENQARLEVVACCPEAQKELLRWLEIYRPLPRPESVPRCNHDHTPDTHHRMQQTPGRNVVRVVSRAPQSQ